MSVIREALVPARGGVRIRAAPLVTRVLRRDWRVAAVFVGPMIVLILGIIAFPFIDSVFLSFTARHGVHTVFVGTANYASLWSDPLVQAGASNSIVFTLYSEIFNVVLGLIAALLLHNLRRGRAVLSGVILLPWIIPTVVTAFMWRAMF